jgi:drug/metabolite transporter (DMT)-like permease
LLAGFMQGDPGHHDTIHRRAVTALLVTTVVWGLSFPVNKALALTHARLEPAASGWFYAVSSIWPRFILGALLLAPLALARGTALRPTWLEAWQGLGLAVFMAAGLLLQVDGLQFTEASTSAFLSQFYVIMLPLVVFGRLRRWPPLRFAAGALLVIAGVAVLSGLDWRTLHMGRGELETIVSTLFFACQILWLGRPGFAANRPIPMTMVMFLGTAGIFLVAAVALAPEPRAIIAPWSSGPWLLFTGLLAVFCTVIAFVLMNTWQPRLNAAEAGLIYAAEPVFASLLAMFLPAWFSALAGFAYANETLTWRLVVGGGLITAANVLVQLRPPAPSTSPAAVSSSVE